MLFVLIVGWRILAFIILFIKSSRRSLKINFNKNRIKKLNNSEPKNLIPLKKENQQSKQTVIITINQTVKGIEDTIEYNTRI
jgi:hypothetical protein